MYCTRRQSNFGRARCREEGGGEKGVPVVSIFQKFYRATTRVNQLGERIFELIGEALSAPQRLQDLYIHGGQPARPEGVCHGRLRESAVKIIF